MQIMQAMKHEKNKNTTLKHFPSCKTAKWVRKVFTTQGQLYNNYARISQLQNNYVATKPQLTIGRVPTQQLQNKYNTTASQLNNYMVITITLDFNYSSKNHYTRRIHYHLFEFRMHRS